MLRSRLPDALLIGAGQKLRAAERCRVRWRAQLRTEVIDINRVMKACEEVLDDMRSKAGTSEYVGVIARRRRRSCPREGRP